MYKDRLCTRFYFITSLHSNNLFNAFSAPKDFIESRVIENLLDLS